MKVKKKKEHKAWNWIKEHKWEIGGTLAGCIGGLILLYVKCKIDEGNEKAAIITALNDACGVSSSGPKTRSEIIDEDIFTDLAPAIENSVLTEGIIDTWLERTYELDNSKKLVTVTIKEQK